jgi:hypothetical protein
LFCSLVVRHSSGHGQTGRRGVKSSLNPAA